MSHALSLVNEVAATWADALFRACWQGGLGIALVWLLCRLWPALPANPRCWLWRLAYAKLLLGLIWLPPLALPLLSKPPAAPPTAQAVAPPVQALSDEAPLMATEPALAPSAAPPVPLTAPPAPAAPQPPPAAAPALPPRLTLPTVQTWLLVAWLVGVFANLGRVASAWRRACILFHTSKLLADAALQADAADLCRRLGLRRVPPLRVSDDLASPLLLGLGRPAILLPAFVVSGSPRLELRLMLAHEMTHLARRDLWWNALPLLAQRLFFFHPLVWLAGHEWALAQEIACDAHAVETTGTPPSAYGRMLLGLATRRRTSAAPLFPTLAVAAPRHTLRRRLHAMQHIGTASRPRLILAAALTALLAVGGLVPWHVVAQSGTPLSTPPAATQKEEASREKEKAEFASRNAQLDAQLAAILKPLSPEQQKKAKASIAFMDAGDAKTQQHIQMLEQHRADYLAAHPNRLSDAQIALVQKVNWDKLDPYRIDEGIRWEQTIKRKLQAHLEAAHDAPSRQGWQRQIAAIEQRRRAAERQIRELEPQIAHEEAEVAAIPEDQRARVAKQRSYDSEISAYKNIALMDKQMRIAILRQQIAGTLHGGRRSRGAAIKAALPPPQAKTASFNAVAVGSPPPLRLAQSVVASPSVPLGVAYTEAKWEELERKQQADLDARNAQADAQLAEIQEQAPPAQLKVIKSQIAFANAEYAKEQKRVQISVPRRAAYIASHPNRLSDAQIAFVQKFNWKQMHHSYISKGVRAELAAIPKDQRDRVAMLRSYDGEISGGRMMALTEKQVWVQVLRQRLAGKRKWPVLPRHASAATRGHTTTLYSFSPRGHRVQVFTQDASGQHLVLDKVSDGGVIKSLPVLVPEGSKPDFVVYDDGKRVKPLSTEDVESRYHL